MPDQEAACKLNAVWMYNENCECYPAVVSPATAGNQHNEKSTQKQRTTAKVSQKMPTGTAVAVLSIVS